MRCNTVPLIGLLGLFLSAQSAFAQRVEEIPRPYPAPANQYAPRAADAPEAPHAYLGPPNLYAPLAPEEDLMQQLGLYPTGPERKAFHPISNAIHQHPCYCVAHHNGLGCGNLKAECVFIFGGCREFYGEPCYKGPNPYPPHHSLFHKGGREGTGCSTCGP
jgi:hypothetical protein